MEREALGLGLGGRVSERQSRRVRMGRRWFWGMIQTLRTQGVLGRVPRAALRCGFSGKGSVAEGPWETSQRTGKPGCSEQVMVSRESSFSQWRGQLIVGVAPQRGLARKQRAGPLIPTCIILGYYRLPALHWRRDPWQRQLPSTKGSPREAGSCAPFETGGWVPQMRGGCPCWVKGMGEGEDQYLQGHPQHGLSGWLPLALVNHGDPGPLVIPSDVARWGGWNRVGGPG